MIASVLFDSLQGLEKLFLTRFFHLSELTPALSCIALNGHTLKVLNFGGVYLDFKWVQIICDNCVELSEFAVNLGPIMGHMAVNYFCENLTPKIRKLRIFTKRRFGDFDYDIQFEILTKRCNKLIALSVIGTTFTIDGINNIMKNLSQTLEKTRLIYSRVCYHLSRLSYLGKLWVLWEFQNFYTSVGP